jgi:hypothetical protein
LQGRSPGDHKRRWGSLRLYLCGDEAGAAAADQEEEDGDEEEDNGTVASAGSFETCPVTRIPVTDVNGGADSNDPEELRHRVQGSAAQDGVLAMPVGEEESATLIQSAFRRFMVRS